jgi:Bacterial SH3 domain
MRIHPVVAAILILLASGFPAARASDIRSEAVRFEPGTSSTVINGSIVGRESVSYTIGAEAGQLMTVRLNASNTATYFNVYAPGRGPGDEALAVSEITGPMTPETNTFSAPLPTSGVYTINVYLYRNAARRGDRSDYSLSIQIPPRDAASLSQPVQNDFADGLAGGPDFWEVTGVSAGDQLNVRQEPSTAGRVVARVDNGRVLRNRGCRMSGGQRWCEVEAADEAGLRGWVAGRFLRESSYTAGSEGTNDALVPGTGFNATGPLPCARSRGQPMGQCTFGVKRDGKGGGSITVFWPDGGNRVIFFENNTPTRFDRSEADGDAQMAVSNVNDLWMVTIGDQRFEIPAAVMTGG